MTAATKLAAALGEHIRCWKVGPGGIVIEIDSTDPDTPALVWDSLRRLHSSTYHCICDGGYTDELGELTGKQYEWLQGFSQLVDKAFEIARRDLPQYR